jgi:hypothetical protein
MLYTDLMTLSHDEKRKARRTREASGSVLPARIVDVTGLCRPISGEKDIAAHSEVEGGGEDQRKMRGKTETRICSRCTMRQ